jgi:hypothetical protein
MKIVLFSLVILAISYIWGSRCLKFCKLTAKAFNKFGQSKFTTWYCQYVQRKIDQIMPYGHEPASAQYQELGKQAQNDLNIAPHLQVPIKKVKDGSMFPAIAGSDGIYVNEQLLQDVPFGAQRYTIFHEAVHIKYNDAAVLGMCKIMGFFLGCTGMYELFDLLDIATLQKTTSILSGIITSIVIPFTCRQFMEHRADIQGPQATQCAACVQEEIEVRNQRYKKISQDSFNTIPKEKQDKASQELKRRFPNKSLDEICERSTVFFGYLSREELKKIAQELGDKKCKYHLKCSSHTGKVSSEQPDKCCDSR